MAAYLIRRLWQMIPTLAGVVLLVFFLFKAFGGDPAEILGGLSASPEQIEAIRQQLGLNEPAVTRYIAWLTGALSGDFGMSLANQRPIAELISGRLGNTLFLASYAALLAIPVSILLGLLTALWRSSIFDRVANLLTLTSISFPEFFVAYILVKAIKGAKVLGFADLLLSDVEGPLTAGQRVQVPLGKGNRPVVGFSWATVPLAWWNTGCIHVREAPHWFAVTSDRLVTASRREGTFSDG